ncbi:MAG: hypothetical protein MUO39_13845 [Steroidobacteraceae bacterium]|nr:hypothetical protein [Steroidobacteraceae bacterium]
MVRYVATLLYAFSAVALGAAADMSRINGSIHVEPGQQAGDVSTVNGSITVGSSAQVHEVETVNGSVRLANGAQIGGALENVNGTLSIDGGQVGGGIETVNGDITVASGSRVDGGIHVEKNRGWSVGKQDRPRVTIESGAVVNGTLRFDREVDLYVGAGATVGPVEGVPPLRHAIP